MKRPKKRTEKRRVEAVNALPRRGGRLWKRRASFAGGMHAHGLTPPEPYSVLGGGETAGLPAAEAAFRLQGVERVNRNKRRQIAALMEGAEGETVLWLAK